MQEKNYFVVVVLPKYMGEWEISCIFCYMINWIEGISPNEYSNPNRRKKIKRGLGRIQGGDTALSTPFSPII
jgi:hypothetical protein